MMKRSTYLILGSIVTLFSCGERFLDKKRDKSQLVPQRIEDYGALFNNTSIFNNQSSHLLALVGSDEYYLTSEVWSALPLPYEKNAYLWADEVYAPNENVHDWNNAYHRILLANIALDGLKSLVPANDSERGYWNKIKGTALFIRSLNYYQLAQLFCKPYRVTAETDLGLPLRRESDITEKVSRSSVLHTYRFIINDLEEAADLLPIRPDLITQPSKLSCYALLAKTYLQTRKYEEALRYSEMYLENKSVLLDFNEIDVDTDAPFNYMPVYELDNPEIIYFATPTILAATGASRINIDSVLLKMYEAGDLRSRAFYTVDQTGKVVFKGSYSGAGPYGFFSGLSTNEQYLIKAECHARLGRTVESLDALNTLLRKRYKKGAFIPLVAEGTELLIRIMDERRKELVLRGISWEDFRRLGDEPELARTLLRKINGLEYTLSPNTSRWVWPIPQNEIEVGGLTQNER